MSEVQTYSNPSNPADDITTGAENALKGLLSVIRNLVHKVPHTYATEAEVLEARNLIDEYEKHALGVLKYEASKLPFDRSGHEDVSARIPAAPPAGAVTQQIDYRELAKAMLALQQETPGSSAVVQPTSVVTSQEQGGGGAL